MKIFFEAIKWIFFFLSIAVGIFFLRWDILFNADSYEIIKQVIMPWYLLFTGIIIGYIIYQFKDNKKTIFESSENKRLIKTFLVGTGIGIILAILYIIS